MRAFWIAAAGLCLLLATARAEAIERKPRTVLPGPGAPLPAVYGFGVSPNRWGWFGAQYRPRSVDHHGYYGDYWQLGYRRGY